MNDMFLFSFVAVSICATSGIIAVLWVLQSRFVGGNKTTMCPITPLVTRLSKITSESKLKQVSFIRERLLRLMMIFERSVVNCFSSDNVNPSTLRTRVSLFTAQEYFCSSQSRGGQLLKMLKAMLFSAIGYLLHGQLELQLIPERTRERIQH